MNGANVVLQSGSTGTNTIYANGTSAASSMSSYFTYYPGTYNVISGSYLSGTLPASVQTIDNNYFISQSGGTTTAYNPSSFILGGGTTNTSGTISNLAASNDQYMTFKSYRSSFYDYQYATNESVATTSSTTYVTRVKLTWTSPVTDNYLIQGYAELSQSTTSSAFQARLTVNGTAVAEAIRTPFVTTSHESVFFVYVTQLAGGQSQTVTLDYQSSKSTATTTIQNARIIATRVGSLQSAVQTPPFTANSTTSNSYVTEIPLSFTPSTANDNWLIVSHAEVEGSTTSTLVSTNLLIDSVQWQNSTSQTVGGSDWYPTSTSKVISLGAGSHTVTIQYKVFSGGTASIRNSRIYAIDLTALPSIYTTCCATSEPFSTYSANTALQTKANLTWTASASASLNYSIWGVGEVSSSTTTNIVTVEMKVDGSVVATENVTLANVNEWKSFFFRKVMVNFAAGSHTVLIQYATNTAGQAVQIKDVRILAWKLPVSAQQSVSVEFTGTSNTQTWGALAWTAESNFNMSSLPVVIQLWNYTTPAGYPGSGYGYLTYTSSATLGTDQTFSQTILNPTSFKDSSGNWKVKISVSNIPDQFAFTMSVDWVEFKRLPATLVEFVTTGITAATPNSLNFTVVSAWNASSVSVTVQAFNYATGTYPLSPQGYATYTSAATPTNETRVLSITTNPAQFLSNGQAKIRISGVLGPGPFQLQANLLVLYDFAVNTPGLYYPTGYNIVQGQYLSGTVPSSVNAIDTQYFTTSSFQASSHISSPASNNATLPASQQRLFQNTRGQKAYYAFYRDTLSGTDACYYAWSSNGATWTTGLSTGLGAGFASCSVIFLEGSGQTLVYLVAAQVSTSTSAANDLVFNIGTIADAATAITWGTVQVVYAAAASENVGFPVIAQPANGYLQLVAGWTKNSGSSYSQGLVTCSSSTRSPTTNPSWTCNTRTIGSLSGSGIIFNSVVYIPHAIADVAGHSLIILDGTCRGVETVPCDTPASGVDSLERTDTLDWDGTTQTFTLGTSNFTITGPADERSAIVNATSGRIHYLYFDGTNLVSRFIASPYTAWSATTVVNSGTTNGLHLTINMGFGSTPKTIVAFYGSGNAIYSRNATDVEVWSATVTEYGNATVGVTPEWVTTPYITNNATGASNSFTYIPLAWVHLSAKELWFTTHNFVATTRTASTEFTFTIPSVSTLQLNFTTVQQFSVASASVTIQVYNYTGGTYPTTGQGYATYTSPSTPSTDNSTSLTITTNPQFYHSSGAVKIKITGQISSLANFNQKVNFVQLYYYEQTYDYVLKIVNQQPTSYTIRLNAAGFTQSNLARIGNFTAWFHDGASSAAQLQALNGGSSLTTQTGPGYTLNPSTTVYLSIRITTTNVGSSTINCNLQIGYDTGITSFTNYRLMFTIN